MLSCAPPGILGEWWRRVWRHPHDARFVEVVAPKTAMWEQGAAMGGYSEKACLYQSTQPPHDSNAHARVRDPCALSCSPQLYMCVPLIRSNPQRHVRSLSRWWSRCVPCAARSAHCDATLRDELVLTVAQATRPPPCQNMVLPLWSMALARFSRMERLCRLLASSSAER